MKVLMRSLRNHCEGKSQRWCQSMLPWLRVHGYKQTVVRGGGDVNRDTSLLSSQRLQVVLACSVDSSAGACARQHGTVRDALEASPP